MPWESMSNNGVVGTAATKDAAKATEDSKEYRMIDVYGTVRRKRSTADAHQQIISYISLSQSSGATTNTSTRSASHALAERGHRRGHFE